MIGPKDELQNNVEEEKAKVSSQCFEENEKTKKSSQCFEENEKTKKEEEEQEEEKYKMSTRT